MQFDPYTPTWHQSEDSDQMLEFQHALVWADPGTGKTLTALEAFKKGKYRRGVVICPKIALTMWRNNIEKHLGLRVAILADGKSTAKRTMFILNGADFIVTTFDLAKKHHFLIRGFAQGKTDVHSRAETDYPSALILDEAHYLKSKDAARSKAILGEQFIAGPTSIAGAFEDVWFLTGTPITRHADDLWTSLRVARRDILRSYGVDRYDQFVDKFCVTELRKYSAHGLYHKTVVRSKNPELLAKLLNDCRVIRRTLEEVVDDMPEVTYNSLYVGYAKTGIKQVDTDIQSLVRELNNPDSPMATVWRKLGIAKSKEIAEYVATINKPILLGYWHTDVGDALGEALLALQPEWTIGRIDGKLSSIKLRDQIMDEFNAGNTNVLLGQMGTLQVSANLQEICDHVVIAECVPSPSIVEQFVARVRRKGQKNHVQVDMMVSDHGIDTALEMVRDRKETYIDKTVDA